MAPYNNNWIDDRVIIFNETPKNPQSSKPPSQKDSSGHTLKKTPAMSNKQRSAGVNPVQIEQSENLAVKRVSVAAAKAIAQARAAKGLTQKDLATKVNEKPTVITEYESGKAIPDQQILAKLEKALGVKLRGKDVGAPFTQSKEKVKK
ncbi:hypothetical protein Zmor_027076 [Zophobas morio]|uniref:HTH cro/C1-type domain-containing protein n=2 Tax=Zophobas morio TaxID=2755281 RepID=A0AA38HJ23_9CUCU|nr:hypothetical protein Zmor_027076 [Zophobas morio]